VTTLLVVDDNADIRAILRLSLRGIGWQVEEAERGAEALERFADGVHDAVVLDQSMPGLTGLEVAERLRADHPELPIVIFSGYLDQHVEEGARVLGVPTIAKPDLAQLLALLRRLTAA
jgi:CheY-like chemotaxis protein